MKSSRNSQAARRRAAAAAAIASVGAGILGTQSAEAGVVTVNLGPTGFNITGVNGGVASGTKAYVQNFPKSSNTLHVLNNFLNGSQIYSGVAFSGGGMLAYDVGGNAKPHNFAAGATIGSGSSFTNSSYQTYFGPSGFFVGDSMRENTSSPRRLTPCLTRNSTSKSSASQLLGG